MRNRLPVDAFEFYYGLGEGRSYQTVADKYGVTKRAVAKLANKEKWQQEVAERDQNLRTKLQKSCGESIEEMTERHTKQIRAIQGRAVSRTVPLGDVLHALHVDREHAEDDVIDKDIALLWPDDIAGRRVITGADLLGRLLRGITAESPPGSLRKRVSKSNHGSHSFDVPS